MLKTPNAVYTQYDIVKKADSLPQKPDARPFYDYDEMIKVLRLTWYTLSSSGMRTDLAQSGTCWEECSGGEAY